MIPRIIHYVWVGPRPLPAVDRARVTAWQAMLPDWEIRQWGNRDIDFTSSYVRQAFAVRAWNRVSDYTRMDALARFGGVYLDTDVDLVGPLEPLLADEAFLGFQTSDAAHADEMVNGAVFGATPGHWLPTALRAHFNERLDGRDDIGSFAGPGLLTQIMREHGLQGYDDDGVVVDGVRIHPTLAFYPYFWGEELDEATLTEDTIAIHRWAESWSGRRSRAQRVRGWAHHRFARLAPAPALAIARRRVTAAAG